MAMLLLFAAAAAHRPLLRHSGPVVRPVNAPRYSSAVLAAHRPQLKGALPTAAALGVWGTVMASPALTSAPLLFRLHVVLLSPMVPLGTAAVASARRRLSRPTGAPTTNRRARATRLIQTHFVLSAGALYLACAGLLAIWLHKERTGKPHFATLHGRAGSATLLLWLGSYAAAQLQVWRDVWLEVRRGGRLAYAPRWLWGSKWHRQLGAAAYAMSLLATGLGIASGWGRRALGDRLAIGCAAVVAAVGIRVLGPAAAERWRGAMRRIDYY